MFIHISLKSCDACWPEMLKIAHEISKTPWNLEQPQMNENFSDPSLCNCRMVHHINWFCLKRKPRKICKLSYRHTVWAAYFSSTRLQTWFKLRPQVPIAETARPRRGGISDHSLPTLLVGAGPLELPPPRRAEPGRSPELEDPPQPWGGHSNHPLSSQHGIFLSHPIGTHQ